MLVKVRGKTPVVEAGAWVADTAVVTGDVVIGKHSSIWFNTVIRGDSASIRIGEQTNIQDNCSVHAIYGKSKVVVGNRVSVGHLSMLHGCEIQDDTLVGMSCVIMDGAVIGKNCIVAAGSLVTAGSQFGDNELIMGRPAKAVRKVKPEETQTNAARVSNYLMFAHWYQNPDDVGSAAVQQAPCCVSPLEREAE